MKSLPLWPIPVGLLLVFALLSTACGSVRQAALNKQKENDLKQIGLAYHNYCDMTPGKGPANADVLLPLLENNSVLVQKMKSGEYVIIWNVNVRDPKQFPSGLSGTVLGYEGTTPTAGGLVLMADASVRKVTAAEFSSMPQAKAGPTNPAPGPGPGPKKK